MSLPQTGIAPLDEYCESVKTGDKEVCDYVYQAVERHYRDLERQDTEEFPYYFDNDKCMEFVEFFSNHLEHYEGLFANEPIKFEPWQYFVFGSIFAWQRVEKIRGKSVRRFREAIIEIPKKQGKSIIAGGIALYGIGWDGVGGAQVYGLAKNRSHAEKLSYRAARVMVEKNEELKEEFRINYSAANMGIYNDPAQSFFQPLTSKPESTDGLNVHMAINDETKDWADFEIYNIIKDGTISMYNSLIINITTAGPNKYSLGYDRRTYLTKILDGTLDDEHTFGVIYTIDEGDEEHWDQEWVWKKAMPNYNVSVFGDKLKEKVPACRESQFEKNSFVTKHLNVWTDSMDGWMNMDAWDRCGDDNLKLKDVIHLPCVISVDLSSKIDLTEVKLTFFKGEEYWTFCFFFLPEKRLENRQDDNENMKRQLKEWAADGFITLTPGETVDYDYVKEKVLEFFKECDVLKLAYDPWNATQFINDLQKEGIPVEKMLEYSQSGYKNWSEPMKQTEKLVIEGKVHHDNNPVQKWCMGNVIVKQDVNDNIRPDKEFPQNKIDGAVTLIMAVGTRMFGVDENEGLSPAAQRAMAKRKKEAAV